VTRWPLLEAAKRVVTKDDGQLEGFGAHAGTAQQEGCRAALPRARAIP
jgi:hypothetical protein